MYCNKKPMVSTVPFRPVRTLIEGYSRVLIKHECSLDLARLLHVVPILFRIIPILGRYPINTFFLERDFKETFSVKTLLKFSLLSLISCVYDS